MNTTADQSQPFSIEDATPPADSRGNILELADIIDVAAIQSLMDDFYALTHIGVAVLDMHGKVLVATGWQDICTQFHRVHPESQQHCIESDLVLSNGVTPGTFRLYHCQNNMWDMSTPIMVGDVRVGNLFLGQFFFDDEAPDTETFRAQARHYGFDEEAYLAALARVPRWSRQTVDTVMAFYTKFAGLVSNLGHSNVQLGQALAELETVLAKLGDSEAKYRILTENATEAIYVAQAGQLKFANLQAERLSGYPRQALLSRPFTDFIHADDRDRVRQRHEQRLQGVELPSTDTFRIRNQAGETRWVELHAAVIDWEGSPATLNLLTDITERKHAEQRLRQSERDFANLAENASDLIVRFDSKLRHIYGNRAAQEAVGVPLEASQERKASELPIPAENAAFIETALTAALETGSEQVVEQAMPGPAGWRWYETRIVPERDAQGQIESLLAVSRDITERKQAEDALRKSEELLRTIAENYPNSYLAIIEKDLTAGFTSGREFKKQGLDPHQFIGVPIEEVFGEHTPLVREHYLQTFAGKEQSFELFTHHQYQLYRTVPLRAADGSIGRILVVVENISERKRAENALRALAESSGISSADTFRFLVRELALSQGTRYALLARVEPHDPQTAHTVAVWSGDGYADNFSYALEGTPCRNVTTQGTCFYPRDVQKLFPQDSLLVAMDAQSYWGAPLRDSAGNVLGILAILDDRPMEEREQTLVLLRSFAMRAAAEMERLRTEDKYQTLFREMLDGFALHEIICDATGTPIDYRFLAVNPAFERMTGLNAAHIVGKTVRELLPTTEQHWIDTYGRVALTGQPAFFEQYAQDLGRHFEVSAYRPAPNQFVSIFADVTERVTAKEAIQKTANETQWMLKSMMNAFVVFDSVFDEDGNFVSHRFVFVNDSYERVTGVRNTEVQGKTVHEVWPNTEESWVQAYGEVAVSGQPKVFDMYHEATRKFYHCNAYRPGESQDRFCVVFEDITERQRMALEREKLQEQLLQAQKMEAVGRLAGGVAHDFNNMLTAILGYTSLALDEVIEGTFLHKSLQEIQRAAKRSADLTRQLLAFARRQAVQPQVLELNEIVPGILKMLQRLIGEDITLDWMPAANLWRVKMDAVQVDQVLTNLMVNARDAIGGVGHITLETSNVTVDETYCSGHAEFVPGEYVLLTVNDTGRGMDAETLTHVFEPFFTTKGTGENTGLGLATVYGIVKQNGGFVNVYSEPGQGTSFKIYLPRCTEKSPRAPGALPDTIRGGGETVLLVEDETALLELAETILRRLGYTVLAANTPGEALRIVNEYEGDIQLLITDVVLPQMNGRQLAERIQGLRPGIKCLYTSGYTVNVIAQRGIVDDDVHFIQKPFVLRTLAAKVRQALEE